MSDAAGPVETAPAEGGAPASDGGGEDFITGLYGSMDEVPEELRPYITDQLKKHEGNAAKKLQEHSEYRKRFEPYEQLGIDKVQPDDMQGLLNIYEMMQDPEQFQALVQDMQQHLGMDPTADLDEDSWAKVGQQNGWLDDQDEDSGPDGMEAMEQRLAQMLDERLGPIQQAEQSRQQEQQVAQVQQKLESRYQELETEHGELDEQSREHVLTLAQGLIHTGSEDPIGQAFEQYLRVTGSAEGRAVDQKLDQPDPAMNGGRPGTAPPQFSWNGNGQDPKEAARARFRG